MGNQRLQRRLLGTRWSQMLVFSSNAGGGVVKKTSKVQGVLSLLCRVLESTIETPVGGRCRETLKTPRCMGFLCNVVILLPLKFLLEAGVVGQRPKNGRTSVLSVCICIVGHFKFGQIYLCFVGHLKFQNTPLVKSLEFTGVL